MEYLKIVIAAACGRDTSSGTIQIEGKRKRSGDSLRRHYPDQVKGMISARSIRAPLFIEMQPL